MKNRSVREGVKALALIVILLSLAGCSATEAAESNAAQPEGSAAPTSGPNTGDLFLHGTVTRGDDPVAGANVWITLFPEDDDSEVGETIDVWESVPVTTDDDGHYAIRLDPDGIASKYFPADHDYLNFELQLVADKTWGGWHDTLHLLADPKVWRTGEARAGDDVLDMSVDLDRATIAVTDSVGRVERSDIPLDDDVPAGLIP